LRGHRLERPRKQRVVGLLAGRPRHFLDVAHHVGRQAGVLVDLHRGREIGERFHPGPAIDVERVDGGVLAELLDDRARHIGPLLQHRALDGGHERRGQAPRGDLVLLDQQGGLALDGEDRRNAEPDDEHDDDQKADLERERRPEHAASAQRRAAFAMAPSSTIANTANEHTVGDVA